MKKIEAVIRHHKLDDVKAALTQVGVHGITVTEARGYGRQKGHTETYRGVEYTVDLLPKLKLEILAPDDMVASIIEAIMTHARSGAGQIGDGKIFVTELVECVRIRTGETGEGAI